MSEVEDERWRAHLREHKTHESSHDREQIIAQRALDLVADTARENKEASNEWRGAMDDRERTLVSKAEMAAVDARVGLLERADIARQTRESERDRATIRTMALLALGATLLSITVTLLIRFSG